MREEEKKRSSLNKFFRKRWVFPAIYLASAALLISMIFWYQTAGNNTADKAKLTEEGKELTGMHDNDTVIEVNQSFENVSVPVKNQDEVDYVTQFYDANASMDEQEAALIVDGNKYRPNMGIDIAMKDGSEFEVLASLSGKVTAVRNDSLLGNVIEVDHDNGVKTIYQSVKDMQVKSGDTVKQGQVLGKSGTSQINKEANNHLHFEIRKDNTALNPLDFFGQPFTAFENVDKEATDTDKQEDASGETKEDPAAGDSDQQETDANDDQSQETDVDKDGQSQETDVNEKDSTNPMTDE